MVCAWLLFLGGSHATFWTLLHPPTAFTSPPPPPPPPAPPFVFPLPYLQHSLARLGLSGGVTTTYNVSHLLQATSACLLLIALLTGGMHTNTLRNRGCCQWLYAWCCSWIKSSLLALEQHPTDALRADESTHPISLAGAVKRQAAVDGKHDQWDYR